MEFSVLELGGNEVLFGYWSDQRQSIQIWSLFKKVFEILQSNSTRLFNVHSITKIIKQIFNRQYSSIFYKIMKGEIV